MRRGLFLALVVALFARSPSRGRQHEPSTLSDPYAASFTTLEVSEDCAVSCWSMISCGRVSGPRANFSLWNACCQIFSRRKLGLTSALFKSLTIFALLCGDIQVLPGPASRPAICHLCDKVGAKNAVKIPCSNCGELYHGVCLAKMIRMPAKEISAYRKNDNYVCWSCTLPTMNDSFWSLPPPPPSPPKVRILPRKVDKSAVTFICFNARSLKDRKKTADVLALLTTHEADVCAISETWLSPDVHNHEVLPRDYVVLRKDRLGGRRPAGGVALAIRPHLQPKRLQELEGRAEIVWAQIKANSLRFLVGSAYRRPNADTAYNSALLESIELAAAAQQNFDGCFLMGDLNIDVCWQTEPPRARAAPADEFLSAFTTMALTQHIKTPTRTTDRSENILDLFLSDVPELVAAASVVCGVSDHDALSVTLSVSSFRPITAPRELFDFRRANWDAMNDVLEGRLRPVLQKTDVQDAWESWKKTVLDCAEEYVPKRRVGGKRKSLLPWMNAGLKKLIKIRDDLFRAWLGNKTADTRECFVSARRSAQKALRAARDNWLWKLGKGPSGSSEIWRYINSKTKVPTNTVNFESQGKSVSEPREVAAGFSAVFQSNFSSAGNIFPFMRRHTPCVNSATTKLCELVCSSAEVHNRLQQIKADAAAGPGGLPAPLLKYCAATLAPSLAHIFNKSLESGELPADWKTAAVTPIFKDGEKNKMQNYRPISVTSLVGKTLERIVRDKTLEYLEKENVIPSCQHGFRAKRSCTTLLTGTVDSWTAILDATSGAHIHAVFLDWSKAFDKVPHPRLLSKLQHYGIDGQLLKWYENFLVGRTQFVRFHGASSEPSEVASGVVQGSVLGPLLFNIFVADLPEMVKNSTLVQYADDATVYNKITSQENADELQEDLCNIDIWCANNGMILNAKKCKVMDITHARVPLQYEYTLGDSVLEYVDKERMLGVHISNDLRWHAHTEIVRAKAAQTLSFAARNLRGCTPRVKRVAYLTLVRPVMTYGLPAWHPTTQDNINRLERVQKRAVHFIYGRNPPPIREQNIMPFLMLLKYNDLNFFKKCECGETDFNARARIIQGRILRGDNALHPRLQPPPTRSVFGQRAFSFRVVKPWNDLPPVLKDSTAAQFPALLKQQLWSDF